MKKTTTLLALALCLGMQAQTEHKVIKATDSSEYDYHYYYNEQNQLVWMIFGTTRNEYTYNEAGQLASMKQNAWVEANKQFTLLKTETYQYDANGNVVLNTVEKNGSTDTYEYSDFENGIAKTTVYCERGKYYYDRKTTIEYNADNTVAAIRTQEFDRDYPEDGYYKLEDTEYTYTDGYKTAEKQISYKSDGSVRKTFTMDFAYTEVGSAYVPRNLKAVEQNGTVNLSWDAVEGATAYVISYDLNRETVTDCQYQLVATTGERIFAVQAIVGDELRNAAFASVEVFDPGKLPVTDLAVGTVTETVEETESSELATRTFYNIPLSWTMPAGHSKVVKFNFYYNSKTYGKDCRVSVTEPAITSYTLKVDPFEVAEWDEEGTPYKGIETPIYMTITYETGESEKSNVVYVNPFKTLGHEVDNGEGGEGGDNGEGGEGGDVDTAVQGVAAQQAGIAYTLSGQRTGKVAKGLVVKNKKVILAK